MHSKRSREAARLKPEIDAEFDRFFDMAGDDKYREDPALGEELDVVLNRIELGEIVGVPARDSSEGASASEQPAPAT